MRLKIENGFYKFYPVSPHELTLISAQGFEIVPCKDFFTFPFLQTLQSYSIEGIDYHGITAIKTYSGTPEEVLLKNRFVYDLKSKALKNLDSIVSVLKYAEDTALIFNELPQAGANIYKNKKIKNLSGYWNVMGSGVIVAEAVEFYVD